MGPLMLAVGACNPELLALGEGCTDGPMGAAVRASSGPFSFAFVKLRVIRLLASSLGICAVLCAPHTWDRSSRCSPHSGAEEKISQTQSLERTLVSRSRTCSPVLSMLAGAGE